MILHYSVLAQHFFEVNNHKIHEFIQIVFDKQITDCSNYYTLPPNIYIINLHLKIYVRININRLVIRSTTNYYLTNSIL